MVKDLVSFFQVGHATPSAKTFIPSNKIVASLKISDLLPIVTPEQEAALKQVEALLQEHFPAFVVAAKSCPAKNRTVGFGPFGTRMELIDALKRQATGAR
jgi:hypothetical protein